MFKGKGVNIRFESNKYLEIVAIKVKIAKWPILKLTQILSTQFK